MKSGHLKVKGQRSHTNKQLDGKLNEDPFNYNMTVLIGCTAVVTTLEGEVYEGIFAAFSSQMEILLEAAHLVTDSKDDTSIDKHFDVVVIPGDKILSMKCINADLEYPTREFVTDTAISSGRGGQRDKELTPWEGEEPAEEVNLDAGTGNGWEAKDMFKKNEEKYGVVSTFRDDLSGYTTQVDRSDTDFSKMEQQANAIAEEIEGGTASREKCQMENGDEDTYSAVVRPRNYTSNTNTPVIRQRPMQQSVPPPTQPSPPSNNNGPSDMNNNSGNTSQPMYNQNQNPRNDYGAPPNPVYLQERRYFDSRRPLPPDPYELRPQRMSNKVPMDRKDPELNEFGQKDASQMRRLPGNPPLQIGIPPPHVLGIATPSIWNPSHSSAPWISSIANLPVFTTSGVSAVLCAPSTPKVANTSTVSASSLTSTSTMTSPSDNHGQTSTSGDSKSGQCESKKKAFTFNPDAKEFNPSWSTCTPPRQQLLLYTLLQLK